MPFHSPTEIQLSLHGVTVPAVGTFDRLTGQARYRIAGDQVRGSFIVVPETSPASGGCQVRIVYGDHPAQPQSERVDEPRIRRTRVRGECGPLDVDAPLTPAHIRVRGQWVRSDGTLRALPFTAEHTLSETVHAIVTHWATRPNREGLIRAATRHAQQQPDIPGRAAREAMERELDGIRAQIAPHWEFLQQLEAVAQADTPRLPTLSRTVHIDFLDPANGTTGVLVASPLLNAHDGTITYTVTSGGRTRGGFTVGPDRFSRDALPGGVSVQLGTAPLPDGAGRENEPVVHGIQLRGSWNCADVQSLTLAVPAVIPGIRRADAPDQSVPANTTAWISAAIRALAMAYRDHRDVDALRLTAAKSRVDQLRQSPVQAVVDLRSQEASAQARVSAALEAEAAFASLSA